MASSDLPLCRCWRDNRTGITLWNVPLHGCRTTAAYDASAFHCVRNGVSWRQSPLAHAAEGKMTGVACPVTAPNDDSGTSSTTSQKSVIVLAAADAALEEQAVAGAARPAVTSKPS